MPFYNKSINLLTDDEIVAMHLSSDSSTTDYKITSSLHHIMREVRHAWFQEYSKYYLPLMGCFAFLDEIGTTYRNKSLPPYTDANASGIKKALYYFCGLGANDKTTRALYALRNGMMHDASLVSHSKSNDHYWFRYDFSQEKVIRHPLIDWSGNQLDCGPDTLTMVNPRGLVEEITSLFNQTLPELHSNNNLEIALLGGAQEIRLRYLLERKK